jgi:Ca-activated chloride channel family protein
MGFVNFPYMGVGLLIVTIFAIFLYRFEATFFKKVKLYWFYEKSSPRKISTILFLVSLVVFAISLGDLRGREEMIESSVPLQKTVVLIDSSASMLVEDVRPNRIKKAGLIARHFVRNSFGHQVSLSVFSDIQKKIVPFTDDIDILEARLQTLMDTFPKGGSNLSLALNEAAQYFKTKSGYAPGNILLITDGEEHSSVEIDLPKEITLAVVGLGSEKGGKIPVRRRDGSFLRYKEYEGKEVISKINKNYFENLVNSVENGKIWYVQSYGLPTTEILKYFSVKHKEAFGKGSFRQRPVKGYFLIKLAIIVFAVSVIFSRFRSLVPLACLLIFSTNIKAEPKSEADLLLEKFKRGEISKSEKLRLAEIYARKKGDEKKGVTLYQNTLKDIDKEKVEDVFNFGTALLKTGNFKEGIELYKYLDENREIPDEMKEVVKKHIQLAFNQKKSKGGKSKDDKDKKDKKNQDQKNKDQKDNKDSKQNKGQNNKDQKNKKNDKKKDQKSKDNKSDKNKKDKKDKNKKKDQQKNKKDKNKQKKWDDLKKQVEKKKKTSTVKGVLKQIMNDDSNLQRKFLDASSENDTGTSKDW